MELRILDRLVKINSATQPQQYMLSHYLTKLAQLGVIMEAEIVGN